MKICIVTDSYPPNLGGAELAIGHIAQRLAQHGYSIVVVTGASDVSETNGQQTGRPRVVKIPVGGRHQRLQFGLRALPALLSEARRCDVIHGTTYGGALPAALASMLLRKPSILMVHEFMGRQWFRFEPSRLKALFYYLAEKLMVHFPFTKFVAVSEYTKSMLLRLGTPAEKVTVVYHGVEPERFESPIRPAHIVRGELGLNSKDYVYLAFGRTGITKGMEFLAEAAPLVWERVPNARFVFILMKYDRRSWLSIQQSLAGLPNRLCQVLEPVSRQRLFELLNAADCVVIPSLSEGFGFTAAEASSLNKRVVVTKAGALPEVVSGYHVFVEPGSVQALADGCVKAFEGKLDYTPPKNFDWEITIEQYRMIYNEVLQQTGKDV